MKELKPKFPTVACVYYKSMTDKRNKTRAVKVEALLQMTSVKQGYVKECDIISLECMGQFELDESMRLSEIGRVKFLSALYWYETRN